MPGGVVKIDRLGSVVVLTMDRPQVKNAFDDEMYSSLTSALVSAENDPSVNVVVLTGSKNSGYFTSGADLTSFTPRETSSAVNPVGVFMRTLLHFKKPIIAAVNGPAIGIGVTMLAHVDVVVCSECATFWTPFARIGVVPEYGSSVAFPRVMGRSMASEMLLFGRKLSSSEALACGLVSRVVRDGDSVVTAAVELAKGLTEAPLAQRTALLFKRVMLQGHLCSESVERAMNFEFDILDERLKNGEIFEAASQTLRSKQQERQQKAKL